MDWPARLLAIRKAKGWTQADLAHIVGAHRNTIVGLEAGRQEPSRMLQMAILAAEAGLQP